MLSQHTAVLGKTGAGKTITSKLMIEQVVAEGARVCILDPLKSDWWGLTSSADGKHAGLAFQILGGPHGHVPLHSSSGKAVAEIVATGALPLSIIDMAEFEPGGQARFFTEFAPALLRKMRGVVYLVVEEAHLFAPKERSGIGSENLSIHWAKTIATAGRSKGIRLILATQRTQALHNALLGSCDTLIAHRLTAPADQEPVVKWLKANTTKEILADVSSSLASLKTGEGWICSGEARQFERVAFPMITTYDNTATPTGDGVTREIKTAPVDREKLRAIIGDAVAEAEAQDPRRLRARIAELERQAKKSGTVQPAAAAPGKVEVKIVEKPIVKPEAVAQLVQLATRISEESERSKDRWDRLVDGVTGLLAEVRKVNDAKPAPGRGIADSRDRARQMEAQIGRLARAETRTAAPSRVTTVSTDSAPTGKMSAGAVKILNALAELEALGIPETTRHQLGMVAGYNLTGGTGAQHIADLIAFGLAEMPAKGSLRLTGEGRAAATATGVPTTLTELHERILARTSAGSRRIAEHLIGIYPESISRADLGQAVGYNLTGGTGAQHVADLITVGAAVMPVKGRIAASPLLFPESLQ
jgi:hypothetical protein